MNPHPEPRACTSRRGSATLARMSPVAVLPHARTYLPLPADVDPSWKDAAVTIERALVIVILVVLAVWLISRVA